MKLSNFKNDKTVDYVNYFERLVESQPTELIVFSPKYIVPRRTEADVYFLFPCDDSEHFNCGFFNYGISIKTMQTVYDYLENLRKRKQLTQLEVAKKLEQEKDLLFNKIVPVSDFTEGDIINYVADWVQEWVEEIKNIKINLISTLEYNKYWCNYEEFHLLSESFDVLFSNLRDVNTNLFKNNKQLSFKEVFRKMLDE